MDDSDDTLKLHRDLIIACGWGKEVDVILLLQQGASVRVQDQVYLFWENLRWGKYSSRKVTKFCNKFP